MKLYKRQIRLRGTLQTDTHDIPKYCTPIDWTDEEDFTDEMVKDATKDYYGKNGVCWWDFYEQERYVEVEDNSIEPETCPYCGKSNTNFFTAWVADDNLFTEQYYCQDCDKYYHVDYDITNPRYRTN